MRGRAGVTLLEMMVVVAIFGIAAALAVPGIVRWNEGERLKSAARSVADALNLGRSEAIRTGNQHLVVFALGLGATQPIEVIDDGPVATANCTIDAGEVVHSIAGVAGVSWGTSTGGANGAVVPGDTGVRTAGAATGSTFTNASMNAANGATWVLFHPDGMPRTFTGGGGTCTAIGNAGEGGGGIYLTNQNRDYGVVLQPLGLSRVHRWDPNAGAWSN